MSQMIECPDCQSQGFVTAFDQKRNQMIEDVPCAKCLGAGFVPDNYFYAFSSEIEFENERQY